MVISIGRVLTLNYTYFHRAPSEERPVGKFGGNPGDEVFVEKDDAGFGADSVCKCFRLKEIFVDGNIGWKRTWLNLLDGASGIKHAGSDRPCIALPPGQKRTLDWLRLAEDVAQERDRFLFGIDDSGADRCLMQRAPGGTGQEGAGDAGGGDQDGCDRPE